MFSFCHYSNCFSLRSYYTFHDATVVNQFNGYDTCCTFLLACFNVNQTHNFIVFMSGWWNTFECLLQSKFHVLFFLHHWWYLIYSLQNPNELINLISLKVQIWDYILLLWFEQPNIDISDIVRMVESLNQTVSIQISDWVNKMPNKSATKQ